MLAEKECCHPQRAQTRYVRARGTWGLELLAGARPRPTFVQQTEAPKDGIIHAVTRAIAESSAGWPQTQPSLGVRFSLQWALFETSGQHVLSMKSSDFRLRHAVIVGAGAVSLAILYPLFANGNVSVDIPSGSTIHECGAAGAAARGQQNKKKLELTAQDGLQFRCGANQALNPPSEDSNNFLNVFEYIADTENCNTTKPSRVLAEVVKGATLTKSESPQETPVYTLRYSDAPAQARSLCYTCSPSPGTGGGVRGVQGDAACTIHIKVQPKEAPITPPGSPDGENPPPRRRHEASYRNFQRPCHRSFRCNSCSGSPGRCTSFLYRLNECSSSLCCLVHFGRYICQLAP